MYLPYMPHHIIAALECGAATNYLALNRLDSAVPGGMTSQIRFNKKCRAAQRAFIFFFTAMLILHVFGQIGTIIKTRIGASDNLAFEWSCIFM